MKKSLVFDNRLVTSVVAAIVATTCTNAIAQAGTIRHDRSDWEYRNLANFFPSVGYFSARNSANAWGCSGTLIGSSFVLTAAHCIESGNQFLTQGTFWAGGNRYSVTSAAVNRNWFSTNRDLFGGNDIAVLRLASNVGNVAPASLFSGFNEDLQLGTYVGFGETGNGITGAISGSSGTKRAGQNTIGVGSRLSNYGYNDRLLVSDFDDPRTADYSQSLSVPQNLEYQLGRGDSGGGLFINGKVAGIHSFISSFDGLTNSSYTDISASTRVSFHNSWINGAISALNSQIASASGTSSGGSSSNSGNQSMSNVELVPEYDFFDDSYQVSFVEDNGFDLERIPEPSTVFGLLAFSVFGALGLRKGKQKSASSL